MQDPPLLAVAAVLVLAASCLQGCDDAGAARESQVAVCPAVPLPGGGSLAESVAGQLVEVRCPRGTGYQGPELECGWVDRVCVAYTLADVDPRFCMDTYNLTRRGEGLMTWPDAQEPLLLAPQVPRAGVATGAAGAHGRAGKATVASKALPSVVDPLHLQCAGEASVDLDFQSAVVLHSNLFGQGPDRGAPRSLLFGGIATLNGQAVDLEVIAVGPPADMGPAVNGHGPGPRPPLRAGKTGATGRLQLGEMPVSLTFRFQDHTSGELVVLPKIFFTVFDLDQPSGPNLEVMALGLDGYLLAKTTSVSVKQVNSTAFIFGGTTEHPTDSALVMESAKQVVVKEMWMDALRRAVALVFRDVSQFTLVVRAQGPREFEFAGQSEVAYVGIGRQVTPSHSAAAKAEASAISRPDGALVRGAGPGHRMAAYGMASGMGAAMAGSAAVFLLLRSSWCTGKPDEGGPTPMPPGYRPVCPVGSL